MAAWGLDDSGMHALLGSQFDLRERQWDQCPHMEHRVLIADGEPAGSLVLRHDADDALYIADIALLPSYRSRGIGTRVLQKVVEEADRRGQKVALHVRSDNPGARRLYERIGFVCEAESATDVYMARASHRAEEKKP